MYNSKVLNSILLAALAVVMFSVGVRVQVEAQTRSQASSEAIAVVIDGVTVGTLKHFEYQVGTEVRIQTIETVACRPDQIFRDRMQP